MSTNNFKRVFVWEMPVRVFHWITVATVTALAITGFIIANPPAIQSSVEATNSYWFGIVRYIHFLSAYLFFVNMIMRIYWSFAGNKFAHWSNFWPFSKKRLKNVMHVLKVDVLLMNEDEHDLTNLSVGHNAVAGFSYAILFLLALVQVFTGFGDWATTVRLPPRWVIPLPPLPYLMIVLGCPLITSQSSISNPLAAQSVRRMGNNKLLPARATTCRTLCSSTAPEPAAVPMLILLQMKTMSSWRCLEQTAPTLTAWAPAPAGSGGWLTAAI